MQINTQPFEYYDHESEKAVLQAIYLDNDLIYQIDLTPEDFHNSEYRQIYIAMLQLYADGLKFELKTLTDVNPSLKALILSNIFYDAFTSANINYHANLIKAKTFQRKCKNSILHLQQKLGDENFLIETETMLTELYEAQNRISREYSTSELLSKIRANIKEAKKLAHYGIQTGFNRLNEACVGLCPKHFWILGAYTSYGKSTWLSQLLNDICLTGAGALVFSCEDSAEDKLTRLLATKTGIPIRAIIQGYGDEEKLRIAQHEIESYNLQIYDDCYSLEEMEMKIKKCKLRNRISIVAIDFVQNIITGSESIYDCMREVAIKLQKMAKKHEICILGLSQITSDEKGKISLRGAQELASAADIVLWIDRKPEERHFDLIIRKNRSFGKTGKIPMTFTETWTGIEER